MIKEGTNREAFINLACFYFSFMRIFFKMRRAESFSIFNSMPFVLINHVDLTCLYLVSDS